jgi:uncharacterized protein YbaP (TraB family)
MSINSEKNYAQGFHYVVRRKEETIADIVGTCHAGEEAFCRLNPTIESVAIKASKVSFEHAFFTQEQKDRIVLSKIVTRYNVKCYYTDFNTQHYEENKAYKYPSSIPEKEIIELHREYSTERLILKVRGEDYDTVISLETPEEYAETLNCFEMQEEFSDEEEINAVNGDTYDAYRKGDEVLGKQVMKWTKYHDPAYHHYIRKKRNHTFALRAMPLIENSTPENRVLIAVGYTHLLGKHSFLNLLKQQLGNDYSIMPFTSQNVNCRV